MTEPPEEERDAQPDFHDDDGEEGIPIAWAEIHLETHGVKVSVRATGEMATHDAQVMLDKAVEAIAKIQTQIQ